MSIMHSTDARKNFYKLIAQVLETSEPTYITSKHGNVVLISEEDYNSMLESLYLNDLPGMKDKIIKELQTPLSECKELKKDE